MAGEVSELASYEEGLRSLIKTLLSMTLMMVLMIAVISTSLVLLYIAYPLVREIGIVDKFIPDAIKLRINSSGHRTVYKKKSDNPTDRAEYLLKEMEKEDPSDVKLIELKEQLSISRKNDSVVELLKTAADIEKYYVSKSK